MARYICRTLRQHIPHQRHSASTQAWSRPNTPPSACRDIRHKAIYPDVRGYKEQHTEPRHVIHRQMESRQRQPCPTVNAKTKHYEQLVHPSVNVADKHREERYAQIEPQKASREICLHHFKGEYTATQMSDREILIASHYECRIYHNIVEQHLKQKLKEFPKRYRGAAHKVARNQHEAVDTSLTPHAKEIEEEALCRQRTPGQLV